MTAIGAAMEPADLVAIVLVLAALFGSINQLWVGMQASIGVLLGALVLSLLIVSSDHILHLHVMGFFRGTLDAAGLPHLFLNGVLALLLFAGALQVDLAELNRRRWMILLLATASVIISTSIFGAGMWALFAVTGMGVPVAWCFVLGAILAPTDAVVVETLLRQIKLAPALRAAIVGESLFNDGAGVVLFLVALGVTQGETVALGHGQILAALAREIAGGAAIGVIGGFVAAQLIRRIKDEGLEIIISLALVMGCYRLANVAELSGPIAVVTAGLTVGAMTPRAPVAADKRTALVGFWSLLDQVLNTMLFLLIGIEILGLNVEPLELVAVVVAIPLAIVARLVSVALPSLFSRQNLREKARDVAVLTWAGLRGGISVALALTLPPSPWRAHLLVVTYAVVVFTIVVQGLTMTRVLGALHHAPAE